MATSQFKIYTSSDPQGPGVINGYSGSLIRVLNACLVDGYGTGSYYKAPAGWTKPQADYSASIVYGPQLACYKMPSGSQCTMFINDAYPNATAGGREAWMCGFEQILNLTASAYPLATVFTASAGNGTGIGQFPTSAQLLTYGHTVVRKSVSSGDATARAWFMVADAYTMYLFIKSGDNGEYYMFNAFGDFFALNPSDRTNCMIMGRPIENNGTGIAAGADWTWVQVTGAGAGASAQAYGPNWTAQPGHYLQRGSSGTGQSLPFSKKGDCCGANVYTTTPPCCSMSGVYACPNGFDNSYYIHPVQVIQSDAAAYRGRLRGLYQICHSVSNFGDGQVFSGGGDYYGKTFMVVKYDYQAVNMYAIEISATIETNS